MKAWLLVAFVAGVFVSTTTSAQSLAEIVAANPNVRKVEGFPPGPYPGSGPRTRETNLFQDGRRNRDFGPSCQAAARVAAIDAGNPDREADYYCTGFKWRPCDQEYDSRCKTMRKFFMIFHLDTLKIWRLYEGEARGDPSVSKASRDSVLPPVMAEFDKAGNRVQPRSSSSAALPPPVKTYQGHADRRIGYSPNIHAWIPKDLVQQGEDTRCVREGPTITRRQLDCALYFSKSENRHYRIGWAGSSGNNRVDWIAMEVAREESPGSGIYSRVGDRYDMEGVGPFERAVKIEEGQPSQVVWTGSTTVTPKDQNAGATQSAPQTENAPSSTQTPNQRPASLCSALTGLAKTLCEAAVKPGK